MRLPNLLVVLAFMEFFALVLTLLFGWLSRRDRLRFNAKVLVLEAEHRDCRDSLTDLRKSFDLLLTAFGLDSEEPL